MRGREGEEETKEGFDSSWRVNATSKRKDKPSKWKRKMIKWKKMQKRYDEFA